MKPVVLNSANPFKRLFNAAMVVFGLFLLVHVAAFLLVLLYWFALSFIHWSGNFWTFFFNVFGGGQS